MLRANQAHCSEWSRLCLPTLQAFPSPCIRLTPITAFQKRTTHTYTTQCMDTNTYYIILCTLTCTYRYSLMLSLYILIIVSIHTHTHTPRCILPSHWQDEAYFISFFCSKALGDAEEENVSHKSRHKFIVNGLDHNVLLRCTQPTYGGLFLMGTVFISN